MSGKTLTRKHSYRVIVRSSWCRKQTTNQVITSQYELRGRGGAVVNVVRDVLSSLMLALRSRGLGAGIEGRLCKRKEILSNKEGLFCIGNCAVDKSSMGM